MQVKFSNGNVMVTGNVTKEPELKYVGEKHRAVVGFSIAAGKREDGTTIFINLKAWGRLAEYASVAKKGDAVCAIGRVESREYNGKTYSDLVCDWLNIAGAVANNAYAPKPQEYPPAIDANFTELDDMDDGSLPF
jgi:hypothetical protein